MKNDVRFPIRLKIMVTVVFVVTAVVSVITFTMATLFHEDKSGYIRDLASQASSSAADESRTILTGYIERLEVYSRIVRDGAIPRASKAELLQGLFQDFPELIGVTLDRGGEQTSAAFDNTALEPFGLSEEDLLADFKARPIPTDQITGGAVYLRNNSLDPEMPMMLLALEPPDLPEDEQGTIVAAFLRLDSLQRLASRVQPFEVALADVHGTLLAHRDRSRVGRLEGVMLRPDSSLGNAQTAGTAFEYEREGEPMVAALSQADVAGVTVSAQIPKSVAYLASRALLTRLIVVALGLLLFAAIVSMIWARRLTRPVELLSQATREVAQGRFDVRLTPGSRDEIGALAGSFNQMAKDLKDAQGQIVQSAKLAAFGQLGAGIAHEVKNPLAGILGCAQLCLRKAEPGTRMHSNLTLIERETKRCETIIKSLLKFARQEEVTNFETMSINQAVEDALAIVRHQMEISNVHLESDLTEGLPAITGNPNQLQQVFMNLIMNAQQAMEGRPGEIVIRTSQISDEELQIRVRDNGPGIPEEILNKVFEPFFTTKPSGIGTGLGLSVSFGIVQDHGGTIDVWSEVGEGTEFFITLPVPAENVVVERLGGAIEVVVSSPT